MCNSVRRLHPKMKLSRISVLLLGALSLVPVSWMLVFGFYFFPRLNRLMEAGFRGGQVPTDYFQLFNLMSQLHFGALALMVGLLIVFISYLYRSTNIIREDRKFWLIVLLGGNFVALPVVWYHL